MGSPSVTASGEVLSIKLDAGTDAALKKVAIKTGKTKATLVKEAVAQMLEDAEDYSDAVAAVKRYEKTGKAYTLEEVKKHLGLDRPTRTRRRKTA